MSGGHYNFQCYSLGDLAQDILADVEKYQADGIDGYGYEYDAIPKDILDAMKGVAILMQSLSKAAHDIEWMMSGDYGEDTFRKCMKEWQHLKKGGAKK